MSTRGMENTMARLKPYFRIRKAYGKTYFSSEKRQKQQLIRSISFELGLVSIKISRFWRNLLSRVRDLRTQIDTM